MNLLLTISYIHFKYILSNQNIHIRSNMSENIRKGYHKHCVNFIIKTNEIDELDLLSVFNLLKGSEWF